MTLAAPPRPAPHLERGRSAHTIGRAVLGPVLQAILIAFLVLVITFFLIRVMLGDPAQALAGGTSGAGPGQVAALRTQLGLDDPILVQFGHYLAGLVHGDLGQSFQHSETSVASIVFGGVQVTLALVALALVLSSVVAIAVGLYAAAVHRPWLDNIVRIVSIFALSTPGALVGLVLILVVALRTSLFPAGGWGEGYPDNLHYLFLPAVAVSCWLAPIILRVVRERAGEVLLEPFAEAAMARGMSRGRLIWRHVAPNCAGPVLTVIGVSAGTLVSGAVIVEVVFGLPGIGRALTAAVATSDFAVIQGIVLVTGAMVVLVNLAAEIAARLIDPRMAS